MTLVTPLYTATAIWTHYIIANPASYGADTTQ